MWLRSIVCERKHQSWRRSRADRLRGNHGRRGMMCREWNRMDRFSLPLGAPYLLERSVGRRSSTKYRKHLLSDFRADIRTLSSASLPVLAQAHLCYLIDGISRNPSVLRCRHWFRIATVTFLEICVSSKASFLFFLLCQRKFSGSSRWIARCVKQRIRNKSKLKFNRKQVKKTDTRIRFQSKNGKEEGNQIFRIYISGKLVSVDDPIRPKTEESDSRGFTSRTIRLKPERSNRTAATVQPSGKEFGRSLSSVVRARYVGRQARWQGRAEEGRGIVRERWELRGGFIPVRERERERVLLSK